MAREVRLVGDKGEQLGVMPTAQALDTARKNDLDLVEVAPTANPPVCRILDYGKYKYQQAKKEHEAKKNQKISLLREIRLRPKIGDHDFNAKGKIAGKLLANGDKVKVTIMFRGREITHPELGWKLLQRMAEQLAELSTVERKAIIEGKRMHITLLPKAPPVAPVKPKAPPKEAVKEAPKAEVKETAEKTAPKEAIKEAPKAKPEEAIKEDPKEATKETDNAKTKNP